MAPAQKRPKASKRIGTGSGAERARKPRAQPLAKQTARKSSEPSTGARVLTDQLEALGVEVVFGIPGVHNLAIFDALERSPIRTIVVRHEQTAVYAAR